MKKEKKKKEKKKDNKNNNNKNNKNNNNKKNKKKKKQTSAYNEKIPKAKSVSFSKQLENIKYFRKGDPVLKIKYSNPSTAKETTPSANNTSSNSDSESGSDQGETDLNDFGSPLPEAISKLTTKQLLSKGSDYVEQLSNKEPVNHVSIRSTACNVQPQGTLLQKIEKNNLGVDGLNLAGDLLEGWVSVKNLSYQKKVTIRFTLNDWKTVQDVEAKYHSSDHIFGIDRFQFSIDMKKYCPNFGITQPVVYFAVRYECDLGEFWDNNSGENYRVDFITQRHNPLGFDAHALGFLQFQSEMTFPPNFTS